MRRKGAQRTGRWRGGRDSKPSVPCEVDRMTPCRGLLRRLARTLGGPSIPFCKRCDPRRGAGARRRDEVSVFVQREPHHPDRGQRSEHAARGLDPAHTGHHHVPITTSPGASSRAHSIAARTSAAPLALPIGQRPRSRLRMAEGFPPAGLSRGGLMEHSPPWESSPQGETLAVTLPEDVGRFSSWTRR